MIIAATNHSLAVFMVNILSLLFIAFALKRILYNRRYEDDIDKKVLGLFILGILFYMLGIVSDTLSLLGMHSYLINSVSSLILKTLAPIWFFAGAVKLKLS